MDNNLKRYLPLSLSIRLAKLKNFVAYHNPLAKKSIIIGRNACLGNELLRSWLKTHPDNLVINQQKTRVDIFLDYVNGSPRPKVKIIKKYFLLRRSDLYDLVRQQEKLPWLANRRPVKYLVMDSFSELTDKKFTSQKEGWSFCCFWNDLIHDEKFAQEFSTQDLLPLAELEKSYAAFFDWAREKYPEIKIIFLHYPDELEKREKYRERAKKIKEVLLDLAAKKSFVTNINLDGAAVKHQADEFPYHYGQSVYGELLVKLAAALKQ